MSRKKILITLSIISLVLAIGLSVTSITGSVIGENLRGFTIVGIVFFLIGIIFFIVSKID